MIQNRWFAPVHRIFAFHKSHRLKAFHFASHFCHPGQGSKFRAIGEYRRDLSATACGRKVAIGSGDHGVEPEVGLIQRVKHRGYRASIPLNAHLPTGHEAEGACLL